MKTIINIALLAMGFAAFMVWEWAVPDFGDQA